MSDEQAQTKYQQAQRVEAALGVILDEAEDRTQAINLESLVEDIYHELGIELAQCSLCNRPIPAITAHLHQRKLIGDYCCWDERLRASE